MSHIRDIQTTDIPIVADQRDEITVWEGLETRRFYYMWLMLFFSTFYVMLMAGIFKVFGLSKGIDDFTLTVAGSLGAIANGGSRIFWAALQDRIGFKKISLFICILQVISSATIYFVAEANKYIYVIFVMISY